MSYDETYETLEWFVAYYAILDWYDLSKISENEIFEAICDDIADTWSLLQKGPDMHQDALEDWVTNQV